MSLLKTAKPKLTELAGYDILQRVGEGGMAIIYQGRHQGDGHVVALKILRPQFARDPIVLQRFQQEFDAARKLKHPNTVQVLNFGCEGPYHYLIMEYVEGVSLWDLIQTRKRLPEAEAVAIITQVGCALQEAHKLGLIHRDVKPDNILIGNNGQVKLADLGLVKDMENGLDLTRPSQGMGTPNFMAVEQFQDAKSVDYRCDIYSLAATLFMAVTGRLPFEARTIAAILARKLKNDLAPPGRLAPDVSEHTSRVIRRAVDAAPEKRPPNCMQFIAELTRKTTPATVPARPEAAPAPSPARAEAAPAPSRARKEATPAPRPSRTEVAAPAPSRARREAASAPSPGQGSVPAPAPSAPGTRERRASVRYASDLGCLINPIMGDKSFRWSARVRDVSATGVALLLGRRFEPGTLLSVEMGATADSPSSMLHVRVVRLAKQAGTKKWLLGCAFAGALDDQQAQRFVG